MECITIEIVLQSIIALKSPILNYLCRLLCVMCLGGRLRVFSDRPKKEPIWENWLGIWPGKSTPKGFSQKRATKTRQSADRTGVKTAVKTAVKTWRKLLCLKTIGKTFHEELSQVLSADLGGSLLSTLLGALLVGVLGRQIAGSGILVAGDGAGVKA